MSGRSSFLFGEIILSLDLSNSTMKPKKSSKSYILEEVFANLSFGLGDRERSAQVSIKNLYKD